MACITGEEKEKKKKVSDKFQRITLLTCICEIKRKMNPRAGDKVYGVKRL